MTDPAPRRRFDEEYYRRFYIDRATRVNDARSRRRLADFVFSYAGHLGVKVRRVLDLGCGLGHWRDEVARRFPAATYTGVEVSEYLCEKYGWEHAAVDTYRGRGRYDLVICQGVLQYLDDAAVRRAIVNIARLSRGIVFMEIATSGDLRCNADLDGTDQRIFVRKAAWYRRVIMPHLTAAGGGVFVPKESEIVLFDLERLGR